MTLPTIGLSTPPLLLLSIRTLCISHFPRARATLVRALGEFDLLSFAQLDAKPQLFKLSTNILIFIWLKLKSDLN